MIPSLFRFDAGDWVLHLGGYGFPAFCGVLAALLPAFRRARDAGLPRERLLGAILLAFLGGFAGAKAAAFLQTGSWSGRVLYGGLLGGLAALLCAARPLGLPRLATADVLTPPALLAAAFGRLGCLFAGCCYGTPWTSGLAYPRGSHAWIHQVRSGLLPADAPASLATLPMPLLEAAALFLMALATSRLGRPGTGRALAGAGLLYSTWRFLAEFWRGDHAPYDGLGLTFSQAVSVLVFVASAALLWSRREPRPAAVAAGRLGWAIPAQLVLLLGLAAAGSGTLGCSTRRTQDAKDRAVEYHGRVRDKSKEYYRRAREEAKEDCADDCANFCCEVMCSIVCEDDEDDNEPASSEELNPEAGRGGSGPAPARFTLPQIRPGKPVAIRLDLAGLLNHRTDFSIRLAGDVEALPHLPDSVPYRFKVESLDLGLGEFRLKGRPGEIELRLDAEGNVSMAASTLDADVLSALKALEPLTQGILRLPPDVEAAPKWGALLKREMWARDAQGHGTGKVSWDAIERSFDVRAWISEGANGGRRVQWLVR